MQKVIAPLLVAFGGLAAATRADAAPIVPTKALTQLDVCRERTARGPHKEAVTACREAMVNDGSAASVAAMVRALMSGNEKPTTDELGMASMMARALHRRAPDTIFGHAADCDIAAKLHDIGALEACRDALAQQAPGNEEIARATAAIEKIRTPARVWFVWGAVAVACAAALGHAMFRVLGARAARSKRGAALAAVFFSVHSVAPVARADPPAEKPISSSSALSTPSGGTAVTNPAERKGLSQWSINTADPEKSVPTPLERDKNPLEYGYFIQDLAALAGEANRNGDYHQAVKYYRALAKAVPDRSIAFTKLCDAYEAAGQVDHAIAACRMAIARPGASPADFDDFIRLAFARPGKLHPELAMDLEDLVDQFRKDPATKGAAERLNCELGARTRDVKRLEACVATLGKTSESDAKAITYRWVLALEKKNFTEAEALVERAKKTSMKPEGIEKMRAATLSAEPFFRRWLGTWQRLAVALALLFVVVGIGILVWRSSKARTNPVRISGTPPADQGSEPTTA